MNPYITRANQFNPVGTIPTISSFRDSISCLDTGAECATDLECDDGLYCSGVERCNSGLCGSSGDPCPGEYCDEALSMCITTVCDGDGVCDEDEDCNSCPTDCQSGAGGTCGNGVCEVGASENCVNCPQDCNGVQSGRRANRYCCGDVGENRVGCADMRCVEGGALCTDTAGTRSCCGDGVCEGVEDTSICPIDCTVVCSIDSDCTWPDSCRDAWCDAGICVVDAINCDDGDACTTDTCIDGQCQSSAFVCDDGEDCSADSCDPMGGCAHQFPACGVIDGCCGPGCTSSTDGDCTCARKNAPCFFDGDCCSSICKRNGNCR
jgi:hypothetical protein